MKNIRHREYLVDLAALVVTAAAAVCQAEEPAMSLRLSDSIANGHLLLNLHIN